MFYYYYYYYVSIPYPSMRNLDVPANPSAGGSAWKKKEAAKMTYAKINVKPFNQLPLPSRMQKVTVTTHKTNDTVSNTFMFKSNGLFIDHATQTQNGKTNMAIWVEDPMATPMEMSILLRNANITAEACSAALPTIGNMTTEMNATGQFHDRAAPSMVSTMTSERMEMKRVIAAM